MAYPIFATEIAYQSIVNFAYSKPIPPPSEDFDGDVALVWTFDSTSAMDCLDIVLLSEEAIFEAMTGAERPWVDLHHRSYFLHDLIKLNQICLILLQLEAFIKF